MRPVRYSIDVTLDGCCDHRAFSPGEDLQRDAAENLAQADVDLGTAVRQLKALLAGLSKRIDLELVSRSEFGSGAVAMGYEPRT